MAGLRPDAVRAEPVVSQDIVRVLADSAGRGVGSNGPGPAATAGPRSLSGNSPGIL